ncbi:MAG: hypothetical protein KJI70_01530 [Patescibacteria group bacterium]|nr:hypothetical protein [Patescibacteria group bacterium]
MNQNLKDLSIFLIPIIILSVLGVFLYLNQDVFNQKHLSPEEISEKALSFVNTNILPEGITASLIDITEEGDVYKIRLDVQGTEYQSYVSKDGKYLFPDGYELDFNAGDEGQIQQETSKREMPDVKLFVMSYCPYGLQTQKAFLPVYDLLKNKAEMGVYFVDYIMHGKKEIDENLTQYCIQKDQREKYSEYLSCFVKDDDSQTCLSEAGINEDSLLSCIDTIDEEFSIYSQYQDEDTWIDGQFPKFDLHSALNQSYGVQGSPTIIVNDQIVSLSSRSPEAFKQVVCNAFSQIPEECSQILSSTVYSSGFGLEVGGTSNGQSCSL